MTTRIRNHWFSAKLNADVYIMERRDTGRIFAVKVPRSPDPWGSGKRPTSTNPRQLEAGL